MCLLEMFLSIIGFKDDFKNEKSPRNVPGP
jgi:hypothetical protein